MINIDKPSDFIMKPTGIPALNRLRLRHPYVQVEWTLRYVLEVIIAEEWHDWKIGGIVWPNMAQYFFIGTMGEPYNRKWH